MGIQANETYVQSINYRIKINSTQTEGFKQGRERGRDDIFGMYIFTYPLRQNSLWASH